MRVFAIFAAAIPLFAVAQAGKVIKPDLKNPLRKTILDALRPSIEKDLKQKVIFKVDELRVYEGWAFAHVHPIQKNGKPIDFKKTHYAEALREGMFDGDSTYALLRLTKGKWVVKDFVIGPTDVYWVNWMDAPNKAPKTLFPPPFGPK